LGTLQGGRREQRIDFGDKARQDGDHANVVGMGLSRPIGDV
jgi:hypothetical protein